MSGERNLEKLIATMEPELHPSTYVFCTIKKEVFSYAMLEPLAPQDIFFEKEGVSLVVLKEKAEEANLPFIYPARMITLNVHSSLDAEGFLAAMTKELAASHISVNAFSAYYHDHLFVPEAKAEEAMKVLRALASRPSEAKPSEPKAPERRINTGLWPAPLAGV